MKVLSCLTSDPYEFRWLFGECTKDTEISHFTISAANTWAKRLMPVHESEKASSQQRQIGDLKATWSIPVFTNNHFAFCQPIVDL